MKLVLSGGSIHGVSILGALDYLDIRAITHCFGTSVGSIISTLMVCNYTIQEIFSIFEDTRLIDGVSSNIDLNRLVTTYGVYNMQGVFDVIEQHIVDKVGFSPTLAELRKFSNMDLTITGTNVTKKRCEYFNHLTHPTMRVITCLCISCAVPLLMESVQHNDSVYVDGGVLDNFPIRYARTVYPQTDVVIGICIRFKYPSAPIGSFVDFIRELAMIGLMKVSETLDDPDVYLIEPVTYTQLYEFIEMDKQKRTTLLSVMFKDGRLQAERSYLSKLHLKE